jgi:type III pantothenate kinase
MNDHILIIDIGNTNIVFAIAQNSDVLAHWRYETSYNEDAQIYNHLFHSQFNKLGFKLDIINNIIISSVVPEVEDSLSKSLFKTFSIEPIFVNHNNISIKIASSSPENVGADRLLNAYYLIEQAKYPGMVIDFGTATTFDVVSADKVFRGGIICPGVNLSIQSLHNHTSKLPLIDIQKPSDIIGQDSVSAMQSGIYWGYISMVEGLIRRIKEFHQFNDCHVVATGGLAEFFVSELSDVQLVDTHWTINALLSFYKSIIQTS